MDIKYIPKNLEECYQWLDTNLIDKEEFINEDENTAIAIGHMGIGRYMRNNWELWEGTSELSFWFLSQGIKHPDDMSGIIMTSYWRTKNNIDVNLNKQVQYYIDFWDGKDAFPKEEKGIG